jgi:protein-S-isoprenylcysteine O-methyltransferase Ste14
MVTNIQSDPAKENTDTARGVVRWIVQMSTAWVVFGAILFLAAGKLNWLAGWAYLGLNALTQILSSFVLIPKRPDMLAERSQIREGTKEWDRFFTPAIVIFGTLAVLVTAGLDERFGWSAPIGTGLWVGGLILAFCSQMFVLWAMVSNPFFSTIVRIQDDRGHSVTSSGPYHFVRHPGYLGSIIYNLVIPLVLGSSWTFIPALLTIALIIARTALEDSTLQAELSGYQEYTENVKHRLFPGIW